MRKLVSLFNLNYLLINGNKGKIINKKRPALQALVNNKDEFISLLVTSYTRLLHCFCKIYYIYRYLM